MLTVLLACLAMTVKDAIGVSLTVSEARGRSLMAGVLDAANDLAVIVCTVFGAGPVIKNGVTAHSAVVIGAMMVTSFLGTMGYTRLSRRIRPAGSAG